MKRLALVILTALTLGITGSASAQFGRNYWYLDADTLKVINPNWFIAAQNFIPIVGGTTNLFLGYQSGYSITTGTYNLGLGANSLTSLTSGSYNIGLGYNALKVDTSGTYNVALGVNSLQAATSGIYQTAIGTNTLYSNTTGTNNTAVGANALYLNTLGSYNVGVGYYCLYANTIGSNNTAVGYNALWRPDSGDYNTALGAAALQNAKAGGYNTAVGAEALISLTTAYNDMAFGNGAGFNITTGQNNTIIGANALFSDSLGSYNTALGLKAGYSDTGSSNIFLGDSAGYNETGSNKLYISNSSTSSPLIYGDFTGDSLRVNGQLSSSGNIIGYDNATVLGNLSVNGRATATSIKFASSFTDLLNKSPWYGLGVPNFSGVNGSTPVQLAGYGGVYLNSASGNLSLLSNGHILFGAGTPDYGVLMSVGGAISVGAGADNGNGLTIWQDTSGAYTGHIAGFNLEFDTGNSNARTARMYITTGGHVLIDTTIDNGRDILQANGSMSLAGTLITGGYVSSASDQTFTNSTAQTNVTGLSVPLQANTTYSFTAQLFTSVAANAGEATSVYYGGNTPTYVIYGIVAEDSSVIDVSNWTNTIGTPFSDNVGSAVTPMIKVQGTITTGSTAANLTIRYAQSTAQTSSNTVKRGSWLHVWQTN